MLLTLSIAPPADAPGPLTALVDGLGASDIVTIDVPARRRAVVPTAGGAVGALRATSQPTDRGTAKIAVEAERFTDVGGVAAARSSAVIGVGARLQ